jgi:hypothetical protein
MLSLEMLEERIAPTGAVAVKAAGANLTITGDADSNEITVDQPGAGQFRVVGLNGTLVNGQAEVTFDAVTGNVSFKMGAGDDQAHISNLQVAKNFSFDGGAGNDTLTASAVSVLGSVSVKAGDGNDAVLFDTVSTGGKFAFSGGKDDDIFTMQDCVGTGALTVKGDSGDSAISLIGSGISIAGSVTVSGGDGILSLSVDGWIDGLLAVKGGKGSSVVTLFDLWLGGGLKYTGGAGVDTLAMNNVTSADDASVSVGAGDAAVNITGVDMRGAFSFKGGKGLLNLAVTDSLFRGASSITGSNLDTESDLETDIAVANSTLGVDAINSTVSDVKLKLSVADSDAVFTDCTFGRDFLGAASGREDCLIFVIGGEVAGDVVIKNTASWTYVQVSTTVQGDTAITTGGGSDEVWFDGARLVGALTVKTGGGEDYLWFDSYDDPAGLTSAFDGPVFVDMGSGGDELYIGSLGDGNEASFGDTLILNGGSGDDYAEYLTYDNTFAIDPVLNSFEDTE